MNYRSWLIVCLCLLFIRIPPVAAFDVFEHYSYGDALVYHMDATINLRDGVESVINDTRYQFFGNTTSTGKIEIITVNQSIESDSNSTYKEYIDPASGYIHFSDNAESPIIDANGIHPISTLFHPEIESFEIGSTNFTGYLNATIVSEGTTTLGDEILEYWVVHDLYHTSTHHVNMINHLEKTVGYIIYSQVEAHLNGTYSTDGEFDIESNVVVKGFFELKSLTSATELDIDLSKIETLNNDSTTIIDSTTAEDRGTNINSSPEITSINSPTGEELIGIMGDILPMNVLVPMTLAFIGLLRLRKHQTE